MSPSLLVLLVSAALSSISPSSSKRACFEMDSSWSVDKDLLLFPLLPNSRVEELVALPNTGCFDVVVPWPKTPKGI